MEELAALRDRWHERDERYRLCAVPLTPEEIDVVRCARDAEAAALPELVRAVGRRQAGQWVPPDHEPRPRRWDRP